MIHIFMKGKEDYEDNGGNKATRSSCKDKHCY